MALTVWHHAKLWRTRRNKEGVGNHEEDSCHEGSGLIYMYIYILCPKCHFYCGYFGQSTCLMSHPDDNINIYFIFMYSTESIRFFVILRKRSKGKLPPFVKCDTVLWEYWRISNTFKAFRSTPKKLNQLKWIKSHVFLIHRKILDLD